MKRTDGAPGEDAELRVARDLGRVLELEPETKIRLVRPEACVGLRPREPRERRLELDVEAVAPGGLDHPLHERERNS
jgi:hypothetical protein